ncbi:hypothetical protein BK133_26835 [Paenibacillus sp. FSL H8-0548]|uniref:hypothetical protein n=1 Tax=Paenibacillus sp. FSL H8-0548 TaxID=1920422 RepID=UPI00096FEAF3|nr:hypothetical protein [Paenibacillus sp. FSL H8-0548]OMF22256.1 hypothetical protein BK133_26835 [Paenibacillus sp. FSL H8-0548]
MIKNRNEAEGHELRGCIWKKLDRSGMTKTEIQTKSVWLELLGEQFGEKLVNYSGLEKDQLWKRVQADHEEWKNSSAK